MLEMRTENRPQNTGLPAEFEPDWPLRGEVKQEKLATRDQQFQMPEQAKVAPKTCQREIPELRLILCGLQRKFW